MVAKINLYNTKNIKSDLDCRTQMLFEQFERLFSPICPFLIFHIHIIFYNSMLYSDIKTEILIAISLGFQNDYCINFYRFFSVSIWTFGAGKSTNHSWNSIFYSFNSLKKILYETIMMIIYCFSRRFDHNSPTFIRHVKHFTFYISNVTLYDLFF